MAKRPSKYNQSARMRRIQGLKTFQKVLGATRREFKRAGVDISYRDIQRFTSQNIYGKYKGVPSYKIKVANVKKVAAKEIAQWQKAQEEPSLVDPRELSWLIGKRFEWFWVDDEIRKLPKNLMIQVDADKLGKTDITKSQDLVYITSGAQSIVEALRDLTDDKSGVMFGEYEIGNLSEKPLDEADIKDLYIKMRFVLESFDIPDDENLDDELEPTPTKPRKNKEQETPKFEPVQPPRQELSALAERKIESIEKDKSDLKELFREGLITKEEFFAERDKLNEIIKDLEG